MRLPPPARLVLGLALVIGANSGAVAQDPLVYAFPGAPYRVPDPSRHWAYLEGYGFTDRQATEAYREWLLGQVQALRKQEPGATVLFEFLPTEPGAPLRWRWSARAANQGQLGRIQNAMNRLDGSYQRFLGPFMERRGFALVRGTHYLPDYVRMVQEGRDLLTDWLVSFREELDRKQLTPERKLEAVLRFCQSLSYVPMPVRDGERFIAGFYPPNFLLAERYGDCDMKAVLFAVIWEAIDPGGTALILTSNHMFAAVRGFPRRRSGDISLQIQGEEFLCAEPVGEALIPPGRLGEQSRASLRARDFQVLYPLSR